MKTEGKYILQGTEVVPCNDLMEWAKWMQENRQPVRRTEFAGICISTVFFGLDLSYLIDNKRPLVFETMVFFKDRHPHLMGRWATWNEAVEGHERILKELEGEKE